MDSQALEVNRRNWDSRVPIHAGSDLYALDDFVRAHEPRIGSIERAEVGSVHGKSLLHLQCHIGTDTLSWALLGAFVTGVDFSAAALEQARVLAARMDLPATFLQADVQSLELSSTFDVVFASAGVLCWIEDVAAWMDAAARHLKPGAFLYLFDGHPMAESLDPAVSEHPALDPGFTYFQARGVRSEYPYTYTGDQILEHPANYQWRHPLATIVQAALTAGLVVERIAEHPIDFFERYPFMVRDDEYWRIPGDPIPLTYSILARRPR